MTHQAWQIAYTLHSSTSEPVKIIHIYKINTGKIKFELGPEEYGGKRDSFHCPVKALKGEDFYIQKWYKSWRQDYLLFRADCLHWAMAQKGLSSSLVYKSQDERINV